MPPFHRDGKAYWGGLHRELGLLIYDPQDQQRLAADTVRLYVVAEQRVATFMKDLVRAGLVPSRLETWWCAQHAVVMHRRHHAQGTWWSHHVADGTWCTGQAKATDTPHVPHVLDDPHDDPAFTAWLDAQEARCLTRRGVSTLRHTTTDRRHP